MDRIPWHWSRGTSGESWLAWLRAAPGASLKRPTDVAAALASCASPAARELLGPAEWLARDLEERRPGLAPAFAWGRTPLPFATARAGSVGAEALAEALRARDEKVPARALAWIARSLDAAPPPPVAGEFQLLRATLLLGSFDDPEPLTVDLRAAESAFLAASAALAPTAPARAALASLGAGFAAYAQSETRPDKLADALRHTDEAVRLDGTLGEAHWQAARLRMAADQPDAALPCLKRASDAGLTMLVRAAADADFLRHEERLLAFLRTLRDVRAFELSQALQPTFARLRELALASPPHAAHPAVQRILSMDHLPVATLAQAFAPGLAADLSSLEAVRLAVRRVVADEWTEGVLAGPLDLARSASAGALSDAPRVRDLKRTVTRRGPEREVQEVVNGLGGPWLGVPVRVPGGRFAMGASPDDAPSLPEESPRHDVTLTRALEVWCVPVTQAHYERLMGHNPAYFKGPDRPVETVAWLDALRFCNALSRAQGLPEAYAIDGERAAWPGPDHPGWRLPTEAEWEHACRAGESAGRHGPLDAVAWHAENASGGTHPVGRKLPNAFGLYDMLGNVYEWCWDLYDEKFYRKSPPVDPVSEAGGPRRVVRGGSWYSVGWRSRSSYRHGVAPATRVGYVGFRCVRTVP